MTRGDTIGWVIAGFLLLGLGVWLYINTAPSWSQAQSFLGQLARAFDPKLRAEAEAVQLRYYFSIISMIGGGLIILVGLVRSAVSGKK